MSETDFGSAFVTREKDGTVTIEVRSPGAHDSSKINMPAANFDALVRPAHLHDTRNQPDGLDQQISAND